MADVTPIKVVLLEDRDDWGPAFVGEIYTIPTSHYKLWLELGIARAVEARDLPGWVDPDAVVPEPDVEATDFASGQDLTGGSMAETMETGTNPEDESGVPGPG